ncbi:MAG: Ig-like domain-containing protein, partial [Spirochaetes bacterium]|nr:Ig-like domain-containing protein [Spirochaetota bacterium]
MSFSKLSVNFGAKSLLLVASLFAVNCSGQTYNTLMKPFDLIFDKPNNTVDISLVSATPLTNTRVMLTFSKFVTLASGQNVANYQIKDANGNLLHILAASRDPNNSKIIFIDTVPQNAGTEYTVTARNIMGVDGSSLGSSNSAKFTAPNNADQTGPAFSSASALNATTVEVYFNEAVDLASAQTAGNYAIRTGPGCAGGSIAASVAKRDATNYAKVTLTTGGLTPGTTYYVCGATGIKDIWGNANGAAFASSAFVYNAPAPKVVSAVFNGTGAASTLLVTFDQAMTPTGNIATKAPYVIGGCTGGGSITNASATVAALGTTQVLISALNLASGSSGQCTLTVSTAGIASALGATLSGTANTAVFAYNNTDTTGPAIVSIAPTNTNTLTVTFTEPVAAGTVNTSSFNFSPSLNVTAVSCVGNVCTLTTDDQSATNYTATASGIQDASGNTIGSASTTFTGDGRPYIVGIYPDDPTTIYVQWSEALTSTVTGDYTIAGVTVISATLDPSAPSAMVKLTLTAPGTTSGTGYTLTLPTTPSTTDTTGNTGSSTIPGGGAFTGATTTTAPQVTSASAQSPSTITVNFTEPLNNSTVTTGAFTFDGGCPVATVISATQIQAGVVQLGVSSALASGACTVTVTSVKDLAGNTIAGTNTATFNYNGTGGTDTTPPTVGSVVALDNTHIKVFFSEPVDTSNGANGGANLANYSFSPSLSGGVASASCSGTTCTLTLNAPGTSAVQYGLTISNVKDLPAGKTMPASQTVQFSGIGSSVTPPTLYLATLINATTVELTFSEAMALTAAQTAGNYTVIGGSAVMAAAVQADATKVRLTLDPGAFGSSNSYTVTAASVTDLDGNAIDTAHNSATFNGSATAPSAATLAAASDTGTVGDNITGVAFPSPGMQFTGTVAPNTTVALFMDGVQVGSVVSNGSGGYTVTQTTQPSEGAHTYSVATVGPTGLVSDLSPAISVTFDSVPPAQPSATPVLAAASDSGISNTDAITNATTNLVITGAAGAVEPNSVVTLYDGVAVIGTATAAADGSYSVTVAGPLSEGAHSVTVKATDAAGNQSVANATPLNLTVDTTAPALQTPVVLMANSYIDLTFPEGLYGSNTSNTPLDVSMLHFTLNSGGSGITINPTVTRTDGSPLTGGETTVRVNLNTSGTPDGSETIQVAANNNAIYDAAGNAVSFDTGIKNFSAAGVPNIVGTPTYTSTGLNTGYITVTWDEAPYTATGAAGVLVPGDFTTAFNANGGNATSFTITGLQNGSGGALATGDTTMRILVSFDKTTSGSETFQVNAKSSEIFSGVSPYLNSPVTEQAGPFTAPDKLAPTVANVTSATSDGSYKAGDTVSIQVVFSENVTVTGTPQLTLATGTPATTAVNYVSGSGTNALTFTYTVAAGNSNADLDYSATTALGLNGGSIKDAANNNAALTLAAPGTATSLGSNKNIIVDTTAPTVTNVTSATPNGSYKAGGIVSIQVVFTENVTVTGTPQLTLATGTPATTAVNYVSGSGTNTLTFTYTVAAGNTSADLDYASNVALILSGGSIKDTAGNNAVLTLTNPGAAGSLGANKNIVVDTTAPTVTNVTSVTTDGSYKVGDTISIQVVFNETVNVTGTPQLTLATGTPAATAVNYVSGSGTNTLNFTYTVAAGNTSADLDFASNAALALNGGTIADIAGNNATLTLANPGAANSLGANKALVIDGVAPTVTNVTSATADGSYKAGGTISIQVVFSEAVNVVGTPQLSLATGAPASTAVNLVSGSGTNTLNFTYTVVAGNTSADLDYDATTALTAGTSIKDAAGNNATLTLAAPGAAGSLGANKALVIDTTVPTGYSVAIDQTAINNANKAAISFAFTAAEVGDTYNYSFTSTGGGGPVTGTGTITAANQQITPI